MTLARAHPDDPQTTPDGKPILRLPKQMKHWFERHGMLVAKDWRRVNYIYGSSGKTHLIADATDRRRSLRVLPHLDRMDICDGYMDRWANSLAGSISPIPRTQAAFDAAIATLIKKARPRALETKKYHEENA